MILAPSRSEGGEGREVSEVVTSFLGHVSKAASVPGESAEGMLSAGVPAALEVKCWRREAGAQ